MSKIDCAQNERKDSLSMVIKKTRIQSFGYFSSVKDGSPIYVKVEHVDRFPNKLKVFGFQDSDTSGTTILPCAVNRYAKKNAEQYYVVDKKAPKEEYTQTIYWTRYEWAGRGHTNPVTEFSYITKMRYHRDYYPPYSVNFALVKEASDSYILSDSILYTEENKVKILNTINMVLGVFGECTVEFEQQKAMSIQRRYVNWDILPPGKYPWEKVRETLKDITKGSSTTQSEQMVRSCEIIHKRNPDFVAYGRAGFRGYAVFGFTSKNLYILESVIPNNATYVLQNDWERISQLTKAEILSEELHKARIIHSESWEKNFNKIMEENHG